MRHRAYTLAIETSGPLGSVTLGRGDQVVASAQLPPQRCHTVDLMPVIDTLCRTHGVAPADLGEVYVSIGPGSFTGLRIGVTTAKMLALVLGVKVVAVPTVEVVAQNVPLPAQGDQRLAVCLNVKHETAYTAFFAWRDAGWRPDGTPALSTLPALLAAAQRPLLVLGDPLPPHPEPAPPGVRFLPAELAVARSEPVWHLGRAMAARGEYADPLALLPLYARRPEAEELWEKRHGTGGGPAGVGGVPVGPVAPGVPPDVPVGATAPGNAVKVEPRG